MNTASIIIAAAYLWGAVPTVYLAGRYLKGIDIRQYGSGNVGASNLIEAVGPWTGWLVGGFDSLGKGTLVIVVAKLLDQSVAVQAGAGVAAVAGHNWSVYLRFTGGRGLATIIGVMLGFLMWREMLIGIVTIGVLGKLVAGETALWSLLTSLALPGLAYALGQPAEVVYMMAALAGVLVLKRLTANWESPVSDYGLPRIIAYRLLWDRDVPRDAPWTGRRPPTDGSPVT